jgi:hypothetical protein
VDTGEELCGVEPVLGDAVAMRVRDTVDKPAVFESAQVVGGLPGGDRAGVETTQAGGDRTQIGVGEPVGLLAEQQQRQQQRVAAFVGQPRSGYPGAGGGADRTGEVSRASVSGDRVAAESLDAQQASVGVGADLA